MGTRSIRRTRSVGNGELYLVVDQGGRSTRASAFDRAGKAVASARVPTAEWRRGVRVEQSPDEIVRSARRCVEAVRRELGRRASRVAAAALATQRASIACWDAGNGEALSPVISWQDRRGARALARLVPHAAEIAEKTGLRLSPHYGAGKLRWCLDRLPAVRRALRDGRLSAGPLSSFLAFRLTGGEALADPANASRTLLYDPRRNDWDGALLSLFGIPREILPACARTLDDFGSIPWGDDRIPLRLVSGDQSCALFGFGEPDGDTAYVNAGTGAFVQRASDRPAPAGILRSVVYRDARCAVRVLEGTVNGAASAIDAEAERLGVERPYRLLGAPLELPDDAPLFLNAVSGLAAPFWREDVRSAYVGRGLPEEKLRAVAESVVFLIAVNLLWIEEAAGPCRSIALGGGLARHDAFPRALADATGIPVRRSAETEATARGAAYLVSGRPKGWATGDAETFSPGAGVRIRARFSRWRDELGRLLER